jgi:hypothetical protein
MICPKCKGHLTFMARNHDMWVECRNLASVNCEYRSIIPQMQQKEWKAILELAESCMCDTPEEGV